MPKRKANWWPPSILSDPDVLSVDDEGRFVLCKICHVHYAVHGGKKPKPVIMNSNFRTRAWDVHKERTNSHRLQKQQERLHQAKLSTQQGQAPALTDTQRQQAALEQVQQTQHRKQQIHEQVRDISQSQSQIKSVAGVAGQTSTLSQAPPLSVPASTTSDKVFQPSTHSETQVLQQRRQQQDHQQRVDKIKDAGHHRLQIAARDTNVEQPAIATLQSGTQEIMSDAASMHDDRMMESNSKRPASTMSMGAPASRRRVFRAGLPGSTRQLVESTTHPYEKHLLTVPGTKNHATRTLAPNKHAMAMERQADSSARWRHMHDDVSRALSPAPRRRLQGAVAYTSGEIRAAKTLAKTETGDLGGNNSERVAKKLRSLNAEYHASNMRHADAYNMRHPTDALDRRSASYKEYWGTLRNVYISSNTIGGSARGVSYRKSHSGNLPAKSVHEFKETEADSTTPDESGSSEDAFKPAVVVHDASLVSAIERLADVTSKQLANLYEKDATETRVSNREALVGLTSVMTDLRVLHGHAFERMIELQEKHLKVMEDILDIKLRKEAARNASASISSDNDGTTTSGSSFEKSCGSIVVDVPEANVPEVSSMLRRANEETSKRIPYYCRQSSVSRASEGVI